MKWALLNKIYIKYTISVFSLKINQVNKINIDPKGWEKLEKSKNKKRIPCFMT